MIYQKQPSGGVLEKRCSENMQQICRRTPIPKCDFNKCMFSGVLPFPKNTSGWPLLEVIWNSFASETVVMLWNSLVGRHGLYFLDQYISLEAVWTIQKSFTPPIID